MDRSSTAAFQTEVAKDENRPIHLVSVHLDSGVTYLTDAYKAVSYGGNNYEPVGHFMSFSDIEETAELIVSNVTVSLSGVDQAWISTMLSETYIDRQIMIYVGFLDDAQQLVTDPVLIFDGRIDSPTITENPESGTCMVTVSATNTWVDFNRTAGRHTNHEEQQLFFPGDKGFEFASVMKKDLVWGRK